MFKSLIASLIVIVTLLLGSAVAAAGTVTSERVIAGTPYGTVRLDAGRDYTNLPGGGFTIKVQINNPADPTDDETYDEALDRLCDTARNQFRRYDYNTAVGDPVRMWNGDVYLTCTT